MRREAAEGAVSPPSDPAVRARTTESFTVELHGTRGEQGNRRSFASQVRSSTSNDHPCVVEVLRACNSGSNDSVVHGRTAPASAASRGTNSPVGRASADFVPQSGTNSSFARASAVFVPESGTKSPLARASADLVPNAAPRRSSGEPRVDSGLILHVFGAETSGAAIAGAVRRSRGRAIAIARAPDRSSSTLALPAPTSPRSA